MQISKGRLIVHILLGVYAILLAYILLGLVLGFTISADIFFDLSFALLFFALAQSIFELGTKNALLFLALSSVIGYAAEVLGTSTGFPFGQYNYSELLGPKVLGVPVVVPLIWFVISYVALSAVQGTVTSGSEKAKTRTTPIKQIQCDTFNINARRVWSDGLGPADRPDVHLVRLLGLGCSTTSRAPKIVRYSTDQFPRMVCPRFCDGRNLLALLYEDKYHKKK